MTIPQLKQVKLALSKQGIKNIDDYISKTDENILLRMIGENTADNTASSTADNVEGASDMVGASDDDKPVLITKTSSAVSPASLPSVEGEVVDDDVLPPSVIQTIKDIIEASCAEYKIDDLTKISMERWKGICLSVGRYFRESGVLRDRKREKREGGKKYNPLLVSQLLDIWSELCLLYDKVPLVTDFAFFSGVSESWLRNNNGSKKDLTSASVGLYKKLNDLQETGAVSRLLDGRKNPTGTIFALKNLHGWRDQREVIHTDGGSASAPVNYPTFGMIEDKNEGSGGSGDEI